MLLFHIPWKHQKTFRLWVNCSRRTSCWNFDYYWSLLFFTNKGYCKLNFLCCNHTKENVDWNKRRAKSRCHFREIKHCLRIRDLNLSVTEESLVYNHHNISPLCLFQKSWLSYWDNVTGKFCKKSCVLWIYHKFKVFELI